MAMASKNRQPRLRASCDGCFLAKVKCSKARPICSRCLACGIECRYSPSSRAGKPKSDSSNNNHNSNSGSHSHHGHQSHHHHNSPAPDMAVIMAAAAAGLSPIVDEKGLLYAAAAASSVAAAPGLYNLETGWQSTPSLHDPGSAAARNHSISSELALLAMDENAVQHPAVVAAAAAAAAATVGTNGEMYATGVPWTTAADLSAAQFVESPLDVATMNVRNRSQSFDFSMPGATTTAAAAADFSWMDPTAAVDVFPYSHNQMPTPGSIASSSVNSYFPSPSTTPSLRQSPAARHKYVPFANGASGDHHHSSSKTCACFSTCLYSLQTLHNASSPAVPPFDVVLSLNRRAVEACAAMLACPRCMSRSGTHTAAMLLATVIGKIASFYKTASQTYFDSNAADSALVAAGSTPDAGAGGEEVPPGGAGSNRTGQASGITHASNAALATGLGVSLGAYQLQGEEGRWLELEILNRELRKLDEVYSRFREVCGDLSEDAEVSKAMIGYLGQTLGSTLDLVNHRRGSLGFA